MHRRFVRRHSAASVRRASAFLIVLSFVGIVASFVVRGDAAGADFEVYWTATRAWITGGDPYDLPSDVLPYVYAPWGLPLFLPWSMLPWDAAFTLWRVMTLVGLVASLRWAAMRRPLATAAVFATLSIPIGINLDTGNVTLPLALVIFAARFGPPWAAGIAWGAATGLKWATLPIGVVLGRGARRWGLVAIAGGIVLSILLWPMTLDQLRTIATLERPFPLDYFVLAWAALPWLWTDPNRRHWLRPRTWVAQARRWMIGRRDDRRRRISPPTSV